MKLTPAAALTATLILPLGLHAQPTADYSGSWTMDPDRSQTAQQGEPVRTVTFVITQSVGQVRIETTRDNQKENVLYALTSSRASGSSGQPEAYWDGNRLVTETQRTISGQTVTVKEVRSLGPGSADMTVETTLIVQHGYSMSGAKNYSNSKDVFTKTRP